jgi:hypothetical protein
MNQQKSAAKRSKCSQIVRTYLAMHGITALSFNPILLRLTLQLSVMSDPGDGFDHLRR